MLKSIGYAFASAAATMVTLIGEAFGTFHYYSGTASSGSIAVTGLFVSIRVFPVGGDASFNINGGTTITVRQYSGLVWTPRSVVTAPTVNWVSGSFDYLIEAA
jgi:hypothetical protein